MNIKLLLLAISFLHLGKLFSQDTLNVRPDIPLISTQMGPSCEDGRKEAIADIAAGKVQIKSVGLPIYVEVEDKGYKVYTTKEVLLEDYNLQYRNMGCEPRMDISCYNKYVDSILQAKYGSDYYKKAEAKAERLTAEAKLKCIHAGPAFKPGEEQLKEIFSKKLSRKVAACRPAGEDTRIEFDIDTEGKVQNIVFEEAVVKCPALKKHFEKAIANMGLWQPAVDGYGKPQVYSTCVWFEWDRHKIARAHVCEYLLEVYEEE